MIRAATKPKKTAQKIEHLSCPMCASEKVIKKGFYHRKRNRQVIQKYICHNCGKNFSRQSLEMDYRQKKPDLNQQILEAVSSGVGVRRLAQMLRTTKNTVQRKIIFLSHVCKNFHKKNMKNWKNYKPRFQMDEMETFEGEHGNMLKIPVVVEKDSHFIVDMNALRDSSKSQYPKIKNKYNFAHHKEISSKDIYFAEVVKSCREMKPEGRIVIDTDAHRTYPNILKAAIPDGLVHKEHNMKQNPDSNELFPVNNVMACMRSDMAVLRRKTWHICKSKFMLNCRLKIYMFYNNYLKKKSYKIETDECDGEGEIIFKRKEETPAMKLGIFTDKVVWSY